MKTAVLFRSMTGNSKKIAKAVAAEFNVTAQDIKSKPEINGIDLAFIVGGIYSGKSLPDMIEYLKALDSGKIKKAVLLTSSISDKTGQNDVRQALMSNGIEVETEEFRCRGNFLFIKIGHPDKKEIAGAAEFAKRFIL